MDNKTIDDKAYEEWSFKYNEAFNEFPPYLYMQGLSEEKKTELLKKAVERGYPLDEEKDFGPFPDDADTIY